MHIRTTCFLENTDQYVRVLLRPLEYCQRLGLIYGEIIKLTDYSKDYTDKNGHCIKVRCRYLDILIPLAPGEYEIINRDLTRQELDNVQLFEYYYQNKNKQINGYRRLPFAQPGELSSHIISCPET